LKFLDKITGIINKVFVFIAGIFLALMVIITCVNIVSRLLGRPLSGTVELMGFFGAIAATFALGYTQIKKDHISVTVLLDYMPLAARKIAASINDFICMVLSLIAAVEISSIARVIFESQEVTETLRISFYPFIYAAAAGFLLLAAVFFLELLKVAVKGLMIKQDVFNREFEAGEN
jgi:TRAP-type C4-dicarboxylate transport system permease small subunit